MDIDQMWPLPIRQLVFHSRRRHVNVVLRRSQLLSDAPATRVSFPRHLTEHTVLDSADLRCFSPTIRNSGGQARVSHISSHVAIVSSTNYGRDIEQSDERTLSPHASLHLQRRIDWHALCTPKMRDQTPKVRVPARRIDMNFNDTIALLLPGVDCCGNP
jgi:hypothetical protein